MQLLTFASANTNATPQDAVAALFVLVPVIVISLAVSYCIIAQSVRASNRRNSMKRSGGAR